eukprot:scpid68605/ scgid13813/ 
MAYSEEAWTWNDVWEESKYLLRRFNIDDQVRWRDAASWYGDWLYILFMDLELFRGAMTIRPKTLVDKMAKQLLLQKLLKLAITIPAKEDLFTTKDERFRHFIIYGPEYPCVSPLNYMVSMANDGFQEDHLDALVNAGARLEGVEDVEEKLMRKKLVDAGLDPTNSILNSGTPEAFICWPSEPATLCPQSYFEMGESEGCNWNSDKMLPLVIRLAFKNGNCADPIAIKMLQRTKVHPKLTSLSVIPIAADGLFHVPHLCNHLPPGGNFVGLDCLMPKRPVEGTLAAIARYEGRLQVEDGHWKYVHSKSIYILNRFEADDEVQWRNAACWFGDWLYILFTDLNLFKRAMSIPAETKVDRIAKQLLLDILLRFALQVSNNGDTVLPFNIYDDNGEGMHTGNSNSCISPLRSIWAYGNKTFDMCHLQAFMEAGAVLEGFAPKHIEMMKIFLKQRGENSLCGILALYDTSAFRPHHQHSLIWCQEAPVDYGMNLFQMIPLVTRFLSTKGDLKDRVTMEMFLCTRKHIGLTSLSLIPLFNGVLHQPGKCTDIPLDRQYVGFKQLKAGEHINCLQRICPSCS